MKTLTEVANRTDGQHFRAVDQVLCQIYSDIDRLERTE